MDVTPFDALQKSAKPVVSAVNGLCRGGGLQIALCSDMAVVSDRATFRVPELFRGIADTYYNQMLARIIGPVRTRDLMFTGRTLTAQEALDWGTVARVVPHDEYSTPDVRSLGSAAGPRRQHGVWSSPAWTTTSGCSIASACRPAWATPRRWRASSHSRNGDHRAGCIQSCGWTAGSEARHWYSIS